VGIFAHIPPNIKHLYSIGLIDKALTLDVLFAEEE
jgi:hypothetical protein